MNLDQKLISTFDPTNIDPAIINSENSKTIVTKLRLFDKNLDSLKESMLDSMQVSMQDSLWNQMCDSMETSLKESSIDSMWDSVWKSMKASMKASIDDSTNRSIKKTICKSIQVSIHDSIWHQMWASIGANLSKDEYESLFKNKEILETLPFEKVKELCDLFQWFTKQGLFIHRSLRKGDYLLASWKNPKHIQTINILQEVKQ